MNFSDAAMNTVKYTTTENGMLTQTSSLRATVDLFFKVGASRGQDLTKLFERAYQEDREVTLRMTQWVRDARGGAGERAMFRSFLQYIEKFHFADLDAFLAKVPELGRWDDLLVLQTAEGRAKAFALIADGLKEKNGLCAKWMPRKGKDAVELRHALGMSPKQYRKTLVTLTNVVETAMCAKNWDSINFEHVPSVAMARYQRAFGKNAALAFSTYKAALVKGEAKVNASALFPYDVIHSLRANRDDARVCDAQWAALPNFVGDAMILPIVDVSGSMLNPQLTPGGITPMDVAVSLGLYLADKNTGPFKDLFLTFSSESQFVRLKGSLSEKFRQMSGADWGMSTDINKAFNEILGVALKNKVAPADMPKYLMILSDMQFNAAGSFTAMDLIEKKYAQAGYEVPNVIWWNIAAKSGVPTSFNKQGAALVSGFSPSIVKSILKAENITPQDVMMEALMDSRYDLLA
jgi:hypothetical protein